jgi:arsenate reductase
MSLRSKNDERTPDALAPVKHRLSREFAGIFSEQTVREFVGESATMFAQPEISAYLPEVVERYARDLLSALAQSSGAIAKLYPEVLFVCVKNAARSQMAAAFLRLHGQGRLNARCAGTSPASDIQHEVRTVMQERNVALDDAFPKPLHRTLVEAADVIVTLGCGDACPILPGRTYEDWALPDPSDFSLEEMRALRDDIESRVLALVERLRKTPSDSSGEPST